MLYKIFHILGLLMVFSALGGAVIASVLGKSDDPRARRLVGIGQGVGLLILLVTGFGMIASLKLGLGGWVWAKVGIWLLIGGSTALIRKQPGWANALWIVLPLIGMLAGYLAIYKPF
jgi:hypothetical protein